MYKFHFRCVVSLLCLSACIASAAAQDQPQVKKIDQDAKLRKLGLPDKSILAAHLMWGQNLVVGQDPGERAHRLWGATRLAGTTDFKGYLYGLSIEGKQAVMDMWAAEPHQTVQSVNEIKMLVDQIPLETTIDINEEQRAALRQTVSDIMGINALPPPEGPDLLITFHTARNAKPNRGSAISAYKSVLGDSADDPPPDTMRDLLLAIWKKLFDGQARWKSICPDGCLISVWRTGDGSKMGFHSRPTPLGTRSGHASSYFTPFSTLNDTLKEEQSHTAVVAEVTLLAQWSENANRGPWNGSTFPIVINLHWEPVVHNWIATEYKMPLFPFFPPGGPPHAFSMKNLPNMGK